MSSSAPPLTAPVVVSISVRPAFATVGSVPMAVAESDSGAVGSDCATSSAHASSAAKGASSRAACLTWASNINQQDDLYEGLVWETHR